MELHDFLLKLIQTDSLTFPDIRRLILDPSTKSELLNTLLKNYETYEKLLRIKNEMGDD